METTTLSLLSLLEKPRLFEGHVKGLRQPSCLATLRVASYSMIQKQHWQTALTHYFSDYRFQFDAFHSDSELVSSIGQGICALQKAAGITLQENILIEPAHYDSGRIFNLWIPRMPGDYIHHAMALMFELFKCHSSEAPFIVNQKLLQNINGLIDVIKVFAPQGSNFRFLQAAHDAAIPWCHVAQNTFQYGYGSRARWLDSTFTEKTSQIGASLARHKAVALSLLDKVGLPTPEQYVVKNVGDVVRLANQMGYPVVIKPFNQDGGLGVFSKLTSPDQVSKAFEQAKRYAEFILLEKCISGKDYRLTVLDGELIWAIERIPASVTGDGIHTIQELIEEINQQPERGDGKTTPLTTIKITPDMIDYLESQSFSLATIPELNQWIALNRIANISTGGMPVAVFDKVHPDNKRLAETVANLFRLDIAGIDFIATDISKSYLETNGKIIEVNAQPQLGATTDPRIYHRILEKFLPNQGRIPIIVIVGDFNNQALQTVLSNYYKNIGLVKNNIAYLNNQMVSHASSLFKVARALLFNDKTDALIYCVSHCDDIYQQGLPFDRYDLLFLCQKPWLNKPQLTAVDVALLDTLFRACRGHCVVLENVLDDLLRLNFLSQYKMMLALTSIPDPSKRFPDWIEAVTYVKQNELIIQPLARANIIKSAIPLENNALSNIELCLLSLVDVMCVTSPRPFP